MAVKILPANVAVLYLRMSDERQERSISDQRAELLKYAKQHGYKVLREYTDEAISGDDTTRRKGFLKMREDAAKGEFSVVLSWDQDRFGRFDPIEGGHWILPFRNAGVRLETIAQGKIDWTDFAGRLIYLVQQEGKHAYLRDLSRNSIRGSIAKAKEGSGRDGTAPYGWRSTSDGREIDPEQAEIVARIFREYLKPDGGFRGIACRLNHDGIPSPKGGKWTSSTIRVVLRNRKHTGDFVWGKYPSGRYHANNSGEIVARRKGEKRGAAEPITHDQKFDGIVSQSTFDRVQVLLQERTKNTSPVRSKSGGFVLSGLLRCAHCGSVLAGQSVPRKAGPLRQYSCTGYHFQGKAVCTRNSIDEAPLVNTVVRLIEDRYLSDEALDRLRTAIRTELKSRSRNTSADPGKLKKRLAELDKQIEAGAERILKAPEGIVSALYAKLDELRQQRDRLNAELKATAAARSDSGSDEVTVERAITGLAKLRQAIHKRPEQAQHHLRQIVSRIELKFSRHQHGKYTRTTFESGSIILKSDLLESSKLVTTDAACPRVSCRLTQTRLRLRRRRPLRPSARESMSSGCRTT